MKLIYNTNEFYMLSEETVLDTLLRYGYVVRFSCRRGACKTCKAKLISGIVATGHHRDLPKDVVLPCIARAKTPLTLQSLTTLIEQSDLMIHNPFQFRQETSTEHPTPDPAIWEDLGNGEIVLQVLTDFYTTVYADSRLSPFFKSVTIDRAIGKQYNFLEEIFTGKKVYFGSYPRSAHHWMVIDDDLFDYREQLMERSMIKFGVSDRIRKLWLAIHEHYRNMIVKDKPWAKIIGNQLVPFGGFGTMLADMDMLCDGCGGVIIEGTRMRYHQQEGLVYCSHCTKNI